MKIGIMQPYFFPYLGYWQLMNRVDRYVVLDDVAFIKKGWINRNTIKSNGNPLKINISIENISQNRLINEHYLVSDNKIKIKLIKQIEQSYSHAPYFDIVMPMIKNIINYDENNVALYLFNQIKVIAKYLEMDTEFYLSSQINKDNTLKGQDRIIELCKKLNADTYINAIGGKELYDKESFKKENIELCFLKMNDVIYNQGNGEFIPCLSIIDILMNKSVKQIQTLLDEYTLVE